MNKNDQMNTEVKMRYFVLITTMIILVLSTACTSARDDITSPATPDLLNSENNLDTHVAECQNNMTTIACTIVGFYAYYNRYPDDLEEIGMSTYVCPACSSTYIYSSSFNEETQESEYFLSCPLPSDPNHGFVDNGLSSWSGEQNPPPEQWEDFCRNSMSTIASQAVMFFANNGNRYPDDLEELGMANYLCPACNSPYIYSSSFNEETQESEYSLSCPLPSDPNHGNIENGVPSWQD